MNSMVFAAIFAALVAGGANVPAAIRIEAENFANRGGWSLDTQFVHKMGSAYLIAASAGKCVADAKTMVEIPRAGVWRCWVRTKDWVPAHHPGRFAVSIAGKIVSPRGKMNLLVSRAMAFTGNGEISSLTASAVGGAASDSFQIILR